MQASSAGWVSVVVISLFVIAAIALAWFVRQSRREPHPLLRVEVLGHRNYMLALAAILVVQFSVLALGYAIPNYSQIVNHTGAFTAGGLLVPGCVVGAILSLLSGRLLDKVGARIPILVGYGFMLLSLVLFAWYGSEMNTFMFYAFYVVFTIGQGTGCPTAITFGLSQLPKDLSADGNALVNSFQQLAGAMGTAVVSTIVASQQLGAPTSQFSWATALGTQQAFILLVVMMLVAFVACWVMTGHKKGE